MDERYNCTREQMIAKSLSESAGLPPDQRVRWLTVALLIWESEHGNGYVFMDLRAEAEKIVEGRA
jgi:hypothetical protein